MNIEYIHSSRLAPARYNPVTNHEYGEGDISASYSADVIAQSGRVRKPFKHRWQGQDYLWVSVGHTPPGTVGAFRLVTPDVFALPTTTYTEKVKDAEAARNDPMGFYHGMAVKHAGKTFVLMGPEVLFVAEEPPQTAPDGSTPTDDTLPPVDHTQGRSKAEIRIYLASFADHPDADVAAFDLWGRKTTFGDLRRIVAARQESQMLAFMED
jgi:hypothetical protein